MKSSKNVILIGMPGSGKSTVGDVLAKVLGYCFFVFVLLFLCLFFFWFFLLNKEFGMEGFLDIDARVNSSIEA